MLKHIDTTNLADATAQEVFEFILDHLGKMTEVCGSFTGSGGKLLCFYRHGENRCAAGALLTDSDLTRLGRQFLGSWGTVVSVLNLTTQHQSLIGDLQDLHDSVGIWTDKRPGLVGFNQAAKHAIAEIAHNYKLQLPEELR